MPVSPSSPPKRMTRARAKAVEEKTKTTKVTTASSRAAAQTKSAAAKRKIAIEDEAETEAAPTRPARKVSTKPTVAQSRRGVSTRTATKDAAEDTNEASDCSSAPKARGRPRKDPVAKDSAALAQGASSTAARARARAGPITNSPVAKKTVSFQDHNEDKENEVVSTAKTTKPVKPSTGISAKPARKAAATTITKKSTSAGKISAPSQSRTSPLSPKKETQVAKGSATDVHEPSGPSNLVDELQLDSASCISPSRNAATSMMASPARRPPNSPFKDSFKESPKKLGASGNGPIDAASHPPSSLSQSPKKFNMSSPTKITVFDAPSGSLGGSLFGSPARKPNSPMKTQLFGTPAGFKSIQKDLSTSILASKSPQKFTPAKDIVAITKAAQVESINSLLATVEEHAASLEDELLNAPSPFSPVKKAMEDNIFENSFKELDSPCASDMNAGDESVIDFMDIDTPQPATKAYKLTYTPRTPSLPAYVDEDSEDELSTDNVYHSTPAAHRTRLSTHFRNPQSPGQPAQSTTPEAQIPQESLTVLAERFGQWQTGTPDPIVLNQRKIARSVFSPLPHLAHPSEADSSAPTSIASTPEPKHAAPCTFFEDAMPILIHEDNETTMATEELEDNLEHDQETQDLFRQSQVSEASQIYGDENQMPVDPALLDTSVLSAPVVETCTPVRVLEERPKVIHTVSKVPLKGCDDFDDSPIVVTKKRSQSLVGTLSPHADLELQAMRQIHPSGSSIESAKGDMSQISAHGSDLSQMLSNGPESPIATGKAAGAESDLLKGAVVFVDVHTTEGSDASGLFVDLLTQMGAKCVKSWNWNSRSSVSGSLSEAEHITPTTKIGITHVVFKDGGKRTMEKVREAHGKVNCVGVGWVLDCERENKWLDEADYTVDVSMVPRGGHRRRKSMEPRSLSQCNGELIANNSPKKLSLPQMSPTKEFLNLNSPDRRVSFAPVEQLIDPQTPVLSNRYDAGAGNFTTPQASKYAESSFGSPTTPYFLHPTQLVQHTCPPKQSQELFFPVSGRIADHPDESMRQRLLLARRKSLQFAPKVGSPLGKRDM